MKKILCLLAATFGISGMATAQDNYDTGLDRFPYGSGTAIENKTFDAQNNLMSTTIYTVLDRTEGEEDSQIRLTYTITDNNNIILDQGDMVVRTDDEYIYLNMNNRNLIPNNRHALSASAEMVGGFMDYPRRSGTTVEPFNRMVKNDQVEFTLVNRENKDQYMRVLVTDRRRVDSEVIATPAGSFNATRDEFVIRVSDNDGVDYNYRGIEWYSAEAGIVRTEIYDTDNNLLTYTVLNSVTEYK